MGGGRGGGNSGRLPTLTFVLFLSPIPPTPFPAGRGRILVFLCKGLRPLHPPGLNPGGTGAGSEPRARRVAAIPVACRPCRSGIRQGGLPSLSPARPAFSFISFPYPPAPLPGGKGEIISSFRRGLRPRHPGGGSLRLGARGEESVAYRLARAGRVQPRGCKGRSPLHEITLVSPSPEGKSALRARAGGWGQNTLRFLPGAPPPAPRRREPTVRRKRGGIGCLQVSPCRTGSAPGMQGAKPLA